MKPPFAIVCDFDGTVTTEDLGDRIAIHFGGYEAWRAEEDRYKAGGMAFRDLLAGIFRPVRASREEIADFARSVAKTRAGFERLVGRCAARGWPFVICSAGLDLYVEPVLSSLPPEVSAYLKLRTNTAEVTDDGLVVRFDDPRGGCGDCGLCKGVVVEEMRALGYRVVVCGDGTSDRCAARAGDLVFSRGKLGAHCDREGIAHVPFESFDEVLERLDALSSTA